MGHLYPPEIARATAPNRSNPSDKRVRIDTRKWIAHKGLPRKYSDKIDVKHGGGLTLEQLVLATLTVPGADLPKV